MALPPDQPRESSRRRNRFQRAKPKKPSAAMAVTVISGTLVFAAGTTLIYHVSTLRSADATVRALTETADTKSRSDQVKRLLDRSGEIQRAAAPPPPVAPVETAAPRPAQPGMISAAWNWITGHPASGSQTATTATTEHSTEIASSTTWLQRIRDRQHAAKTATAPVMAKPAEKAEAKQDKPTAATPSTMVPVPPTQRDTASATSRVPAIVAPPAPAAAKIIPEPAPTKTAAVAVPPPPPPPKPEFTLRPFDAVALARFLLSEHDLTKVQEATVMADPVAVPVAAPLIVPPIRVAPSQPSTMQAIAVPQLPPDPKRHQSIAAECTTILEQAQLGDLTEVARKFLQERCR